MGKAIAEAVEWLRNNDPNMNKVDKPTLKSLTKFAGIPMPNKLTPKSKTKAMDKFLDWLRNNNINPDDVDYATMKALTNLAGVSMPGGALTPEEQKGKAIADALDWLRNNDPKVATA